MINSIKKVWKLLLKIAGEYAKIIVFIASVSTLSYWLIGPRFTIEANRFLDEIINPKLNKRDIKLTENLNVKMSEYMIFAFVEALKDTSFLNKIELIVENAAEKVVDEKLTSVMKREMVLKIKEMVKDTVQVIDPLTGEITGYDLYHFFDGGVLKLEKVRY